MSASAAPTTTGKPAPTAVDTSGPSQLIESSANMLLSGIDSRREEFRKDPTGLYKLVSETLLPHFDTPYAAQLVLGTHWRNASADQRKRFVEAFYNSLLYTYGDAMVDFTANRLKVLPTKIDAPPDVAAPPKDSVKTASGLAYKVVKSGSGGDHPAPTSMVEVDYTGWTTDGKMFDSSLTRGSSTTFPLDKVIAGWTEGVQLMKVGDTYRFWIPEGLAYKGSPGKPKGMLVFDVTLLSIKEK